MRSIVEHVIDRIGHSESILRQALQVLSQERSVMDVRRFDQGAAKESRDSQSWGNGSTYCSRAPLKTADKGLNSGSSCENKPARRHHQ